MVLAIIIFIFGIVLITGPALVEALFAGCAAIIPVSIGMTGYFCLMLSAFIVMTFIYNIVVTSKKDSVRRKKNLRRLRVFMNIVSILALLGMLLMVLHEPLSLLYSAWHNLLIDNYTIFLILRYMGILMIVGAVGFFVGKRYQKRQKNNVKVSKHDPKYSVNTFGRSLHEVRDEDLDTHLPNGADID